MTRLTTTGLRVAMTALALTATPARAGAQTGSEDTARTRLKQVEANMAEAKKRQAELQSQAEKLASEINATEREMVKLAKTIQIRERTLSDIERRLKTLTAERDAQVKALGKGQKDTAQLLAALQTMSRRPQALMFLRPASAAETVRSANVMMAVLPALQDQTAALRQQVTDLGETQAALSSEEEKRKGELAALRKDREKLAALRSEREKQRAGVLAEAEGQSARLQKMAAEAKDIQDLLARLEAEARLRERFASLPAPRLRPPGLAERVRAARASPQREAPETGRRSSSPTVALSPPVTPRAGFRMPVEGRVTQRFGAATHGGGSSKGILIKTRREAQVIAPYAGRVVFAGPFRGYGQLLIIAHGDGYHSLLAGMARIDEKVGATVQAGSPVGVMGATEQGNPELYLELRQRGTPVDPLPWLSGKSGHTAG
ncbi:murein hydrolase activator EnvC family protein [Pedomonas mirosovicensis]|uniref:murein hydrolase activator EnvC family protein n=1 Tax=Pedomonas mirosovicensis TaxID=2908641 RepID=UPI0021673080|nr:peptidoglycan DD-metalloendopeptidase family protein [Pedomonas mirosovicensis]MCH8684550.1 peptidoglycan DD-metalloendopeptidase family protein [Pedomonas mirosovicensis]